MLTEISKNSQITIPAAWRKQLGLHLGDRVDMELSEHKIVIQPIDDMSIDEFFTRVKTLKPHNLSPEDINKIIDEETYG